MEQLTKRKCKPCEGGIPALSRKEAERLLSQLRGWELSPDTKKISHTYVMKDFISAIGLIEEIGVVAEADDHHPDLHLTNYRKLTVELSTHAIKGLSDNDFIVAAKIDALPKKLKDAL